MALEEATATVEVAFAEETTAEVVTVLQVVPQPKMHQRLSCWWDSMGAAEAEARTERMTRAVEERMAERRRALGWERRRVEGRGLKTSEGRGR